ncbi:hypothetical protein LOTGIDRAFT_105957 [Lottia gigantea]|uniref:G-protein coupled receptors family 1 profile domain-containing protein n=1 Tax=Lottia gigantea TaxID=225164 RepID=V4A2W6_LOTGI|nr:hypothetical protein LOTGIDRAFT_105957 [Lottia gigantea]ESO89275.1 hypothetical protein LOTGIDRAFT_105957 [Lottia gigantea]
MYSLLIAVAVGGNLAVCYIILSSRKMRGMITNLFLLNLAFSDVVKAVICNPFTFVANLILMYWPFGAFMCPLVTYIQVVAVFFSAFTLVVMSLDRYVAVMYPLKPKLTKKQARYLIVLVWILAFIVPVPTAIMSKISFSNLTYHPSAKGQCLEVWDPPSRKYIYSIVVMLLQYFLPLLVLVYTNCRIGYVVWIKKTPGEAEEERDQRLAASKRRLIKMIIIVVTIYAVCWLPLHVVTLIGDQDPTIFDSDYMVYLWMCFHWLAMSHSCYNPFVYFWINPHFREGIKKLFFICKFQNTKKSDYKMARYSDCNSFQMTDVNIYKYEGPEKLTYH